MKRWASAGPWGALVALAVAASPSVWRSWGVFAFPTLRFLSHTGVVVGAWLVVLVAGWAALRGRAGLLTACFATPAGVFLGAPVAGLMVFPDATLALWGGLLAMAGLWLLVGWRWLFATLGSAPSTLTGVLLGAAAGVIVILAERPDLAATRPIGGALPPMADAASKLSMACGSGTLEIHPLLMLESTSRDGFWPGFSKADVLEGPPLLAGPERRAELSHSAGSIDATTVLPHEVSSHLNRFTDLVVEGVSRPAIRFAGTGAEALFPFEPFDYPHGRPAHFAYLTGSRIVVARGTDAEKGPFVRLAEGELPGGVLRFTLYDGPAPLCTVTFLDFAAQADTVNESPTAGERVPPNVIQFGLAGSGPSRPVIHLSLAETGIGAGLETIKHAPGTYRNRVQLTAP